MGVRQASAVLPSCVPICGTPFDRLRDRKEGDCSGTAGRGTVAERSLSLSKGRSKQGSAPAVFLAVLPSTGSGTARRTGSGTADGRLKDRRWGTVAEHVEAR